MNEINKKGSPEPRINLILTLPQSLSTFGLNMRIEGIFR